jgi:PAS domain S-box-containing protein
MFAKLKAIYNWLPSFSPRFHIAFGLSSLLSSIVLLAVFLGFVPDRDGAVLEGRIALAEAIASTSSVLIKRGDFAGISGTLNFIIERNADLTAVELQRKSDNSRRLFGTEGDSADGESQPLEKQSDLDGTSLVGGNIVSVPLIRNDSLWGQLHFQFGAQDSSSWLDKIRRSPLSLMIFIGMVSLPLFYLYLGKMLKELNPSSAVPARVRSALDTIAESLLVLDKRGNLVLANSAFAELNGKDADELVGTNVNALPWVHEDDDAPVYPWQLAFESGEPTRMDMVTYKDKNGEQRKFIVNCSPVMGGNQKVGGVLVSMDDVTLLEEKEMLLRQSMEKAEAANHAKTAFLSNMSHEIRTPMTAILGFTEVLKRSGENTSEHERMRHLNTISNSGTHLLELINDVLDLSKVESGAMEVESILCDAASIAFDVNKVLKVKADEKDVGLSINIDSPLPEFIYSDPSRLRQIITNLVGNAIKFTEEGAVSVNIEYKDCKTDPRLLIKVIDSGIGMSEAQLATIFDAFTQADASITRRFGGTGLGLSISRKLAIAMQGDIVVTSTEGEGSQFMITLPVGDITNIELLSPEQVRARFNQVSTIAQTNWRFPDCCALVVDDGPENRDLLSIVLSDLGICIDTASNGLEGVNAVSENNYDIVLMDIQMPVMDGYQAVAKMRELQFQKPIVALTANAMKGFEQRVLDAGFSHYMTKPINLDKLTELLAELLGGVAEEPSAEQSIVTQGSESESELEPELHMHGAEFHETSPVYSELAESNPKFLPIAKQFVVRLDEQLVAMRSDLAKQKFLSLSKQAHWLKGSGGTVGFAEFKDPARALENAAKSHNAQECDDILNNIANIRSRVRFGTDDQSSGVVGSNAKFPESTRPVTKIAKTPDANPLPVDIKGVSNDIDPVFSRLPMENPRFRELVGRFIPRLDEQLVSMHAAVEAGNADELKLLAHWMKGSGSNVGFDQFTKLGASLEQLAAEQDFDQIHLKLVEIVEYFGRIKAGWQLLPPLDKTA